LRSDLYSIEAMMCGLFTGEISAGRFPAPSRLNPEINSRVNGLILQYLSADPKGEPESGEQL